MFQKHRAGGSLLCSLTPQLCHPRPFNAGRLLLFPGGFHSAPRRGDLGLHPAAASQPRPVHGGSSGLVSVCSLFTLLGNREKGKGNWQTLAAWSDVGATDTCGEHWSRAVSHRKPLRKAASGAGRALCCSANGKCHQLTGRGTGWHLRVSHLEASEVLGRGTKGSCETPSRAKEGGWCCVDCCTHSPPEGRDAAGVESRSCLALLLRS